MAFGLSAGAASLVGAVAGPVIGGLFGNNTANQAANAQTQSAQQANQVQQNALDWQKQLYGQTSANILPWLNSGTSSLNNLNYLLGNVNQAPSDSTIASAIGMGPQQGMGPGGLLKPFSMSDFQESPAYQFNLNKGLDAINKASASRGNYYAPATLKGIADFAQGNANNEFNNAYNMYNQNQANIFNRLSSMSGAGQNAAVQQGGFGAGIGAAGANTANNIAGNLMGAGNAQAAGMVGGSNALSSGLNSAYGNYQMGQILGNMQAPTYGSSRNPATDYNQSYIGPNGYNPVPE